MPTDHFSKGQLSFSLITMLSSNHVVCALNQSQLLNTSIVPKCRSPLWIESVLVVSGRILRVELEVVGHAYKFSGRGVIANMIALGHVCHKDVR